MNVSDQLTLFNFLMGEPVDPTLARFSPSQGLLAINKGRRWLAAKTKSVQVQDSQVTSNLILPAIYSMRVDVIRFYAVEYNGFPLDPVEPADWRNVIGDNDQLTGTPSVYKLWARQMQIFPCPTDNKTLSYAGWSYPPNGDLTLNGGDLDFTDDQAEAAIYRAAWVAKDIDERDSKDEKEHCLELAEELRRQYRPKGPRFTRELTNSTGLKSLRAYNV